MVGWNNQIVETIKRESPRSVQMSKWNYLFATFLSLLTYLYKLLSLLSPFNLSYFSSSSTFSTYSSYFFHFKVNQFYALCRMRPHFQPTIALISSHCWILLKIFSEFSSNFWQFSSNFCQFSSNFWSGRTCQKVLLQIRTHPEIVSDKFWKTLSQLSWSFPFSNLTTVGTVEGAMELFH